MTRRPGLSRDAAAYVACVRDLVMRLALRLLEVDPRGRRFVRTIRNTLVFRSELEEVVRPLDAADGTPKRELPGIEKRYRARDNAGIPLHQGKRPR